MNTGQMLLVIGALALLSAIGLSINRTLLDSERISVETQAGIMAVPLCQGKIEEVTAVDFDSLAVGVSTTTISTAFAAFACTTRVDYVQAAAPDVAVAGPTSLKRVVVTVANAYMSEGISLRTIVGDY